ncbi:MAG: transposase [Treponema sp.]|nr:transposase [Treponema sp.]
MKAGDNRFLDAILYICKNSCTWRAFFASFGPWHTGYVHNSHWAASGVLERVFHLAGGIGDMSGGISEKEPGHWREYEKAMYTGRNEVERMFRRLGYRPWLYRRGFRREYSQTGS